MQLLWALALLAADPAPPSQAEKEAEAAIRQTLNGSAKAIDGCTTRYLTERPGAKGDARINVTVKKNGWASEPNVQTGLPQARSLRLCLEAVARGWRFPKPRKAAPLGLTVPVAPGVKFRVPAPDEKKQQAQKPKEADKPQGFLRLQPGSFLPSFTGTKRSK